MLVQLEGQIRVRALADQIQDRDHKFAWNAKYGPGFFSAGLMQSAPACTGF
jgi:hypothetical protein